MQIERCTYCCCPSCAILGQQGKQCVCHSSLQFATKSLDDAAFMPLAIEAAGVAEARATSVGISPREVAGSRPTATILGAS